MSQLIARQLAKSYPTPAEPLSVLKGVNLELSRGESLAIVGPSGSGKSTLLAILGTLDSPTSGSLLIDGVDPFALAMPELAKFRAAKIGFVFQEHFLLPQCTLLENVLVPFLADGAAGSAEQDRARKLLDRVGLGNRLTHRPSELSGGERQRAAFARALVRQPLVVLADEPTGNLDAATAAEIGLMLLELQREQNTILIAVTHSAELAGRMQQQRRLEGGQLAPHQP